MVNYHDPVVVAQDYLVLSKLWHAVAGVYFWEFVTTLDYEWSVFRRHRPFRWTIWVYLTTRIATLLAVIFSLVEINATPRYNCKAETYLELSFAFLSTAAASLLIVLRIVAIWKMKKIVVAITTVLWVISTIFLILTIARIHVESIPGESSCVVTNPHVLRLYALVIFPTDIALLLIMFFGLFRLRFHKSSAPGIGRLMWKQSFVWLLGAIIADIPPVVLICLNLNLPLGEMCSTLSTVSVSIVATRIHRGLVDYAPIEFTEQLINPSQANGRPRRQEGTANMVPIAFTHLSRMEAAIPDMYEQDEVPKMSQDGSEHSLIDAEGQLYGNHPGQPRLDENGVGSPTTVGKSEYSIDAYGNHATVG